jgi:predicted amidohydrolase YtcJ
MDGEIGSLEVGKRADVAILAEDPLAVAPEKLKDIQVCGTMLGGHVHLNAARD